jgi:general secretion pathway protein L
LTPAASVRLLHAGGGESTWRVGARVEPAAGYLKPQFVAVEIPEELSLHRPVVMPRMSEADLQEALLLEVRGYSPFPQEDLVWGFAARGEANGQRQVDVVMASRRQVNDFVQKRWPELGGRAQPEVWAVAGLASPVVLSGFGESQRVAHAHAQRRLNYGLLLLACGLGTAVLVTPTAQLRLRALEAADAFAALSTKSAPLVRKRDELVQLNDRLRAIDTVAADRVDPAAVLEHLTRILPDDTYLYSLELRGSKVIASGHTVDASALLQRLSADPLLRGVRSPTAVTRQPGATREAFTVEFTMERPVPVVAAPSPSPPGSPAAAPPAAAKPGSSPFVIGGSAP